MAETLTRPPDQNTMPMGGTEAEVEGAPPPEPKRRPEISLDEPETGEREPVGPEADLSEHLKRPDTLPLNMEVGNLLPHEEDQVKSFAAKAVKARVQARRVSTKASLNEYGSGRVGQWLEKKDSRTEYYEAQKETDKALFAIARKRHEEWRERETAKNNGIPPDPVRDEAHAKLVGYEMVGRYDMEQAELSHDPNTSERGGMGRTLSQTLAEGFLGKETDSKKVRNLKRLGFAATVATTGILAPALPIVGPAAGVLLGKTFLASGVAGGMLAGAVKGAMVGSAIGYMKAQLRKNAVELSTERTFSDFRINPEKFLNPETADREKTDIEQKVETKLKQIAGTSTEASQLTEFGELPEDAREDISMRSMSDIIRAGLLVRSEGLIYSDDKGETTYIEGDIKEIEKRQQRAKTITTMATWASISAGVAAGTAGLLNMFNIVGDNNIFSRAGKGISNWWGEVQTGGDNVTTYGPGVEKTASWGLDTSLPEGYQITDISGDSIRGVGPNGETFTATANAADLDNSGSVSTNEFLNYINREHGFGTGGGSGTAEVRTVAAHEQLGNGGTEVPTETQPGGGEVTAMPTGTEATGSRAGGFTTEVLNSPYSPEANNALQSTLSTALGGDYLPTGSLSGADISAIESELGQLNQQYGEVFYGVYQPENFTINPNANVLHDPELRHQFQTDVREILQKHGVTGGSYTLNT